MANPADIYLDSDGNLVFINLGTEKVEKVNASGTLLIKFDAGDDGCGANPQGVAADTSGNIYVSDTTNGRIMKYDSGGLLVNASFITGLTTPRGLYVYNDYLYVAYDSDVAKYNTTTGAHRARFRHHRPGR